VKVSDGSVMNSEAAANVALTVVALALCEADLTEAQLKAGRSRRRPCPRRGADRLLVPD
jgi:hypothetical protein